MTTNNIKQLESNFIRALGNGQNATETLFQLASHVVTSRNTGALTNVLNKAAAKDDAFAVRVVKHVLKGMYPDGKFADKDGVTVFSYKSEDGSRPNYNPKMLAQLADLAERKLSLRGETFRKELFPAKAKARTLDQLATSYVNAAVNIEASDADILKAVKAALAAKNEKAAA